MNQKPKKLKVYVVISFFKDQCQVHNIYVKKSNAEKYKDRLQACFDIPEVRYKISFHVITKSVKDSGQVQNMINFFGGLK